MFSDLPSVLTLIAAVTAALVSIINAWRNTSRDKEVKGKLAEIHDSTNGNLSKVTEKLESIQTRLDASEKRETELHKIIEAQRK